MSYFFPRGLFLISCVLFSSIVFAEPELKGTSNELMDYLLDQRRVVTITGTGKEKVSADHAIVSIVVKTKEGKLRAALAKNKNIRATIRKTLLENNIAEENIKFSRFSSTPGYSWFSDKPSSYEVNNQIKITIRDENDLEVIAGIVDTTKEVYFNRTELEHTQQNSAEQKALEKSLDNVLAKKQQYESKLGISLSAIRVIEDTIHEQQPTFEFADKKLKGYSSGVLSKSVAPKQSTGFGEIIYRATTRVEFIASITRATKRQ